MIRWVPDDGQTAVSIWGQYSITVNGKPVASTLGTGDVRFPSRAAGPGQWLLLEVPNVYPGDRVQLMAHPSDPLNDGVIDCSIALLNAPKPLARATSTKDVVNSVECDAVVPQG